MKEHPILFNRPMVRAILEGRKAVTRRAVKSNLIQSERAPLETSPGIYHFWCSGERPCPYGKPGDRLWVREAFADLRGTGIEHRPDPAGPLSRYAYAADSPPGSHSDEVRKDYGIKWKPSIHMPRSASRILLEVTAVRIERLHDITDEQCIAEGCRGGHGSIPGYRYNATPQEHFRHVWESAGGDYFANPWVWVIEFRRVPA